MNGPYNVDPREPVYQLSAVLVFDEQAEALALAEQLVGEYRGEVRVTARTGRRPDLHFVPVATFGELP